jgi:pimeloyl-ACP methyl ester carboxylesterase
MQAKGNVRFHTLPISVCCLLLSLLVACVGTTPHKQLRTLVVLDPLGANSLGTFTDTTNLTEEAFTNKVGERIIESYKEFDLDVVEFDDQGKFWSRTQQLAAIDRLAEDPLAKRNGAAILVFVHGWQENADVANLTVDHFRHILYKWNEFEGPNGRRVIGIYVGWRGLSQRLPLLKWLTFWTRKKAAHKIGRGDMDELLVHLGDLKHQLTIPTPAPDQSPTRLVIIGHSFGGAIVFSALDNILKKSTLESVVPFEKGETNTVGIISAGAPDLVVLLNPAFETLLYSGLEEATLNCTNYNPSQSTVLMTIGAENDSATGTAFPIGQFFPSLFQNFKPGSDERVMNTTALGHYTNYFDYRLMANVSTNSPTAGTSGVKRKSFHIHKLDKAQVRALTAVTQPTSAGVQSKLFSLPDRQWKLVPYPGKTVPPLHSPFLVISATPDIVDNHTGIWQDPLVEFLRDFIALHDDRKSELEGK